MSADQLREAALRVVESSCEAQGIDVQITDPVVVGRVAAMLKASDLPHRGDAVRVEAVASANRRPDRHLIDEGGEDRPLATHREVAP